MKTPDTLRKEIARALGRKDWHPLIELARDVDRMEAGNPTRTAFLLEVAKYIQAKPAAVDGDGNVAPVMRIEIAPWAGGERKRLKSARPEDDD